MRVAIFDGILEEHLAESLERAFAARGHSVHNTGRFGVGFRFPTDALTVDHHIKIAQEVVDFKPELIIVFRPASAPEPVMRTLKSSGAVLMAWFCDDPVLWDLSYRDASKDYDVLLHCGDEDIISLYDEHLGRAGGINFPFWTDSKAFERKWGEGGFDSDMVFLGNAVGQLRRRRYHDMATLKSEIKIHGLSGRDYANINHGYLDSQQETIDSCSRARFALNFPQYFEDHRGLDTWFDGLEEFGYFPFPSRVIQYAAQGIPIISVVPDPKRMRHFPEIICVPDIRDVDSVVEEFRDLHRLRALADATFNRFVTSFSAESRVLAIESLMNDDSWRLLNADERASWFTKFNPSIFEPRDSALSPSDARDSISVSVRTSREDASSSAVGLWDSSEDQGPLSVRSFIYDDAEATNVDLFDASIFESGSVELVNCEKFILISDSTLSASQIELLRDRSDSEFWVYFKASEIDKDILPLLTSEQIRKVIVRTTEALERLKVANVANEKLLLSSGATSISGSRLVVSSRSREHKKPIAYLYQKGRYGLNSVLLDDLKFGSIDHELVDLEEISSVSEFVEVISGRAAVIVSPWRAPGMNRIPDFWGLLELTDSPIFYVRTARGKSPVGIGERYLTVLEPFELLRKWTRVCSRVVKRNWLENTAGSTEAMNSKISALVFDFAEAFEKDEYFSTELIANDDQSYPLSLLFDKMNYIDLGDQSATLIEFRFSVAAGGKIGLNLFNKLSSGFENAGESVLLNDTFEYVIYVDPSKLSGIRIAMSNVVDSTITCRIRVHCEQGGLSNDHSDSPFEIYSQRAQRSGSH